MKGIDRKVFRDDKDSRMVYDYFLNPYELTHERLLEEELLSKEMGTGPNCLR